ncbi:MAG: MoaD/ThiS family protein [Tepidisphaeraceae bacterium]
MSVLLAIGTVKGLFVFESADGKSFTLAAHHLPGWEVSAVLLQPKGDTLDILCGTTHYAYGPVLRRSTDGGKTWTQPEARPAHASGSPYKNNRIWQLTSDGGSLYAGIDEAALFKSTDDGQSWNEVTSLTDHPGRPKWMPGNGGLCLHTIVHDYSNPNRIWLGISAVGVFKTEDAGQTWQAANDGLKSVATGSDEPEAIYCIHKIVQHPTRPNTLYMQFHGGVYVTHDGAANWQECENGLPSNFGFPIVIMPDGTLMIVPLHKDERRYFPDGEAGVYRSTDGAEKLAARARAGAHVIRRRAARRDDNGGRARRLLRHDQRRGGDVRRRGEVLAIARRIAAARAVRACDRTGGDMTIDVTVPGLIADAIGGRYVSVDAGTLAEALARLAAHPHVGPLAFDDAGAIRRHVLVFYNDTATRHLPTLDVPLKPGDRLAIVQAVSGG